MRGQRSSRPLTQGVSLLWKGAPLTLALGAALLAAACGADPTPTPTPTMAPTATPMPVPAAPTPTLDAAAEFQAEWDALIQASQAEGRLIILAGGGFSNTYPAVAEHFAEQFDLDVTLVRGSGQNQLARVLAERAAGRYEADLLQGGTTTINRRVLEAGHFILEEMEPLLIHPEVLDESLWYQGHYWWGDVEYQKYNMAFSGEVDPWPIPVYYNSELAGPEDFESVFDLLDPKWRGLIVTTPPTLEHGRQGRIATMYYHPQVGPEWLRRFYTEMDPQYVTDPRLTSDGLARGRFALTAFTGTASNDGIEALRDFFDQPVDRFTHTIKEGGILGVTASQAISVLTQAPHPNAAKLFINWFYSAEGQTVMHEVGVDPAGTLREDVTTWGNVPPYRRRVSGREYVPRSPGPEQLITATNFTNELYQQALGR